MKRPLFVILSFFIIICLSSGTANALIYNVWSEIYDSGVDFHEDGIIDIPFVGGVNFNAAYPNARIINGSNDWLSWTREIPIDIAQGASNVIEFSFIVDGFAGAYDHKDIVVNVDGFEGQYDDYRNYGEGWYGFELPLYTIADGELDFRIYTNNANDVFGIRGERIYVNYDPIPEPTTMLLLGAGLLGFAGARRRMK